MKDQPPTSKLQRNSKSQAPALPAPIQYSSAESGGWELKEETNGSPSQRHAFDLEERTAKFGEEIIRFCKKIPRSPENNRLINQLAGCGTSIGANYCEANEGVSKKDFKRCIGRSVKEPKETKFFLRMIAASEPDLINEARKLFFASIYRK
jgi:four helix bundle protein